MVKILYCITYCRLGLITLFTLLSLTLNAQEADDWFLHDSINADRKLYIEKEGSDSCFESYPHESIPLKYNMDKLYIPNSNHLLHPATPVFRKKDFHAQGSIMQFKNGMVVGSGMRNEIVGVGDVNSAQISYQHRFNNHLFSSISINAAKIEIPHFQDNVFGASGSFFYVPQDNLRFKVFGSYSVSPFSKFTTYNYGGSVSFDMSERFGTEVGVQRFYDPIQKRWETVPIVVPYYKFNKITVGMDVGGILYEILYRLVK